MNKVELQWLDFKKKVVPKTATDFQVRDMRMAFYAGYTYMYDTFANLSDNDQKGNEEILSSIENELRFFDPTLSTL